MFSASAPWVGCPQRVVPINAPWDARRLGAEAKAKAFRKEAEAQPGVKVPRATTEIMRFCDNYERTCKYTALSFFPLAIQMQFKRAANCYFLLIGTLYTIESVSPVQGMTRFGTIGALCVVILASLLSEALQDLSRYRQDTAMNAKQCQVLRDKAGSGGKEWVSVRWRDVRVGDLLKVNQDEQFPADFLILASDNRDGRVYIETASLDGETNLKVYNAKKEIVELMDSHPGGAFVGHDALVARLAGLAGQVRCNPPDNQLYSWSGSYYKGDEKLCNVVTEQLLLRGAVLRKTTWVVGLVVYTGMQTKLKMNDEEAQPKQTQVEKLMNTLIGHLLKVQVAMVCVFASLKFLWMVRREGNQLYLTGLADEPSAFEAVKSWCTFLLLLSPMIPISLYVTMEVVKSVMKNLIDNDYAMYYAPTNTAAEARTANLHEELGQVEYIFSDKTGTLTSNEMELMKCCIDGNVWGDGKPIGIHEATERVSLRDDSDEAASPRMHTLEKGSKIQVVELNVSPTRVSPQGAKLPAGDAARCVDPHNGAALGWVERDKLLPLETGPWMNTDKGLVGGRTRKLIHQNIAENYAGAETLELFWTLLAVCHQTEAEQPDTDERKQNSRLVLEAAQQLEKDGEALIARGQGVEAIDCFVQASAKRDEEFDPRWDEEIEYSAASPDDKALVEGARSVGFTFLGRSESTIVARIQGKVKRWEALCIIPFNSDRKRMSIVLREISNEIVASTHVVDMLYEKAAGTAEFDSETQRNLINPASPKFSAAYLAAWLKKEEYVESLGTPPRIWTKGADSIMRPLLRADSGARLKAIEDSWAVMGKFATVGLRTLVTGTRALGSPTAAEPSALDFSDWLSRLHHANNLDEGDEKLKVMTDLHAEVESRITMCGCTAIEDKLQDGVTATLPRLSRAGLKVWVLTGDKTDTAIEIGMSCNLLTRSQNIVIFEEWDPDDHNIPIPNVPITRSRTVGSDIDPRVLVHIRRELMRLLRELDENSNGAPVYGPPPSCDETGNFMRFGNGTLHFPEDPRSHGVDRYGLYPEDWPDPIGEPIKESTSPTPISEKNRMRTVWPHITKRPLTKHPLAIVIHASVLKAAMDDHTCDEHGLPVLKHADGVESSFDASTRQPSTSASKAQSPYEDRAWAGGRGFVHDNKRYYSCLDIFAELGRRCSVVLCCRVSPRQKAQVVAMGKERFGKICLAIGDGANDVPMIKEAHIGVGISGHEGMQAVLASDYAIAQFCYLERLLLVHGRWSYKRIARLVMFFFYKNSLYGLTAMWMCRHNGFTGMSLFDGMVGSAYNLFTTSLPIFIVALTDRDITDEAVLSHPEMYVFSQKGMHFSHTNFAMWAGGAVWNSMVLFFVTAYIMNEPDSLGRQLDLYMISMATFTSLHIQVHVKLVVAVSSWTTISVVLNVLSVLTWFVIWPIYTQAIWGIAPALWYSFSIVLGDPRFYLSMVITIAICTLSDVTAKFVWRNYPTLYRHPVKANEIKFRLQQEYMGVEASPRPPSPKSQKDDPLVQSPHRHAVPRQKVKLPDGEVVFLPIGSYTKAYVDQAVTDSNVNVPAIGEGSSTQQGSVGDTETRSGRELWQKAKSRRVIVVDQDGGLARNLGNRITNSILGRTESGQAEAVVKDTFGRDFAYTAGAERYRKNQMHDARATIDLKGLVDAGFKDALQARRMSVLAALETPAYMDDPKLLEDLKQITHAMAAAVLAREKLDELRKASPEADRVLETMWDSAPQSTDVDQGDIQMDPIKMDSADELESQKTVAQQSRDEQGQAMEEVRAAQHAREAEIREKSRQKFQRLGAKLNSPRPGQPEPEPEP